jgi:YVTN family beta-propeller protein
MASDENTLYVADSFAGAIHIVDVKDHEVTGSIPLDRTPSGIIIDDSPAQAGSGVRRVLHHLLRRVPAFAGTTGNGTGQKGSPKT